MLDDVLYDAFLLFLIWWLLSFTSIGYGESFLSSVIEVGRFVEVKVREHLEDCKSEANAVLET